MNESDVIGWVGTAYIAIGSYKIAHYRISGYWWFLFGNILFAASGIMTGLTSLVGVSALLAALDIYGIYQWSKRAED